MKALQDQERRGAGERGAKAALAMAPRALALASAGSLPRPPLYSALKAHLGDAAEFLGQLRDEVVVQAPETESTLPSAPQQRKLALPSSSPPLVLSSPLPLVPSSSPTLSSATIFYNPLLLIFPLPPRRKVALAIPARSE